MTQAPFLSLFELNNRVHDAVAAGLPDTCWVHAELSSVNISNGHCYLELVQKNDCGDGLVAKARATIWANRYRMLAPAFKQATGMRLEQGISVLLEVTAEFHELYGLSYIVHDIDPTYTLGDLARRRLEILQRLKADGTLHLNKELPLAQVPRRVAVVSSATAAGYGDFCRQLAANSYGFVFHTRLFPSIMQGDKVEASLIAALDAIAEEMDEWDVVVIIRGGGAVSDLTGFDTYDLASNCAQFPLPIITGIGHDRDETVLDVVAHTSLKTPTAVADFLVECMVNAADHLTRDMNRLANALTQRLIHEQQHIQQLAVRLPSACNLRKNSEEHALERRQQRLVTALSVLFNEQRHRLELFDKVLDGASPERILQRGYSITLVNGHAVRRAADVQPDEVLLTRFTDGEVYSKVLFNKSNKEK